MENISITDMMTKATPVANVLNQDTSVLESMEFYEKFTN